MTGTAERSEIEVSQGVRDSAVDQPVEPVEGTERVVTLDEGEVENAAEDEAEEDERDEDEPEESEEARRRRSMVRASVERSLQTLREIRVEPEVVLSFDAPVVDENDTEWYKRRQRKKMEERQRLIARNAAQKKSQT